ncbi:CDP-alcohol phosphatidyltransferase family protein [Paracoccus sp. SSK6]|uniref:CDP-alcohol phosphatidyltransferase family protein n=1 Tax=Paracoccus sp. SSK6 TaxID=3143131 RepID=UPI003218FB7E
MRDTRSASLDRTRLSHRAGPVLVPLALAALGGTVVIVALQAVLGGTAAGLRGAVAVFLLVCLTVAVQMRRGYPHCRFGACNAVTLLRAALACSLLSPLIGGQAAGWAVAGVAGIGLMLDGLDGHLARRSGLASRFGARFDMEVDAGLALVLSLHILAGTAVGAEILVLGLIRYGFVLAGLAWPWLRADLPDRRWRKAVCVLQIAVLILLQTPLPSRDGAIILARLAAGALIWSFAVDIRWLWARR